MSVGDGFVADDLDHGGEWALDEKRRVTVAARTARPRLGRRLLRMDHAGRRAAAFILLAGIALTLGLAASVWLPAEAFGGLLWGTLTPGEGASLYRGIPLAAYWETYELNGSAVGFGAITFTGTYFFGVVTLAAALGLHGSPWTLRAISIGLVPLGALLAVAGLCFRDVSALVVAATLMIAIVVTPWIKPAVAPT